MPLTSHTTRREGTYYFRMRVPVSLRKTLGKREIFYSLRTKEPSEAKRLAYIHSYNVSTYFNDLKMGIEPSVVPSFLSMSADTSLKSAPTSAILANATQDLPILANNSQGLPSNANPTRASIVYSGQGECKIIFSYVY